MQRMTPQLAMLASRMKKTSSLHHQLLRMKKTLTKTLPNQYPQRIFRSKTSGQRWRLTGTGARPRHKQKMHQRSTHMDCVFVILCSYLLLYVLYTISSKVVCQSHVCESHVCQSHVYESHNLLYSCVIVTGWNSLITQKQYFVDFLHW